MIPVIVWGAGGRMGKRLLTLIRDNHDFSLKAAVEVIDHPGIGNDAGRFHQLGQLGVIIHSRPEHQPKHGVVIDLSLPRGTVDAIHWAQENQWAFVSGTTGLTEDEHGMIETVSENIPVLYAPNFSIGVQLMLNLVSQAAKALPDEFHVSIIETHHRGKRDKPSGTARAFESVIRINSPDERVCDTAALRIDDVVGEHTIRFRSRSEEIVFHHEAVDRDVFAYGALQAAKWIYGKEPGTYQMADVLSI